MKRSVFFAACTVVTTAFFSVRTHAQADSGQIVKLTNERMSTLWNNYVEYTSASNTSGIALQEDCKPRAFPASTSVKKKGMVMFFHGFSACPQQYFKIAPKLSAAGYDVLLPTLPGHGRQPKADGSDYLHDLPSKRTNSKPLMHEGYREFVERMNEIARNATGEVVLAGLSGGGGLATAAAVLGQKGEGNIWDRLLLYAPYYKNPGTSQALVNSIGLVRPETRNDWGETCRLNRSRPEGRNGYCSVTVGSVLAMVQFGQEAGKSVGNLSIPIQIVGVEKDPTADNSEMHEVFKRAKKASFCFYPEGTPHSLIYPEKDLLPNTPEFEEYRDENLPDGPPYEWTASLEANSFSFLTAGQWFPNFGSSEVEAQYGNPLPMCSYKY